MKKYLLVLIVVVSLVCGLGLAAPTPVRAIDVLDPVCSKADPANLPAVCKDANAAKAGPQSGSNPLVGPGGLLTTYIHILSLVVGGGAVVVIILAGLRFATSGGEAAAIASARNTILYAIVGLVIAVLAQALVTFVLGRL